MGGIVMTNEQKTKQIAKKRYNIYYSFDDDGDPYKDNSFNECYASAMDMAEWKDGQLKKILEAIHEDCPKSKAKHYLTLLKNNAL